METAGSSGIRMRLRLSGHSRRPRRKKIGRQFPDNYQSKSAWRSGMINDLVKGLSEGLIFLFDYGVTRRDIMQWTGIMDG